MSKYPPEEYTYIKTQHSNFWGDAIYFSDSEEFDTKNFEDNTFSIYMFKSYPSKRPELKDTIYWEFQKTFIVFEIVELRQCDNPKDMYFGKVKAIDQKLKEVPQDAKK